MAMNNLDMLTQMLGMMGGNKRMNQRDEGGGGGGGLMGGGLGFGNMPYGKSSGAGGGGGQRAPNPTPVIEAPLRPSGMSNLVGIGQNADYQIAQIQSQIEQLQNTLYSVMERAAVSNDPRDTAQIQVINQKIADLDYKIQELQSKKSEEEYKKSQKPGAPQMGTSGTQGRYNSGWTTELNPPLRYANTPDPLFNRTYKQGG